MSYQKFKFLKYECVTNNDTYTISLNPEDSYQFWNSDDRMEVFTLHHAAYLKKLTLVNRTNVFTTDIYLEISPTGRLHYHGTIKILNKKLFYLHTLHKLQSYYVYEIDTIADSDTWFAYCTKQDLKINHQIGNDFRLMTKDFYTKKADNIE